jgi:hypothetical protein
VLLLKLLDSTSEDGLTDIQRAASLGDGIALVKDKVGSFKSEFG